MRILLAAQESAGIQVLRLIDHSAHELVAVLTKASDEIDVTRGATVAGVAKHLGYPVWPASLLTDAKFASALRAEAIDVLLNVHSLYIIQSAVLSAARVGAFNLHPGPLPRYAGMNAPSWSLLHGETEHGVTLHWMEEAIDTGDIAYQCCFPLQPDDTGLTVSTQCVRLGLGMIRELLAAGPGEIPRIEQNLADRRYYGLDVPFDGYVQWNATARGLERFVRASDFSPLASPWGIPTARWRDEKIGLAKVALTHQACQAEPGSVIVDGGRVLVATRDEWLELRRLSLRTKSVRAIDILTAGDLLHDGRQTAAPVA